MDHPLGTVAEGWGGISGDHAFRAVAACVGLLLAVAAVLKAAWPALDPVATLVAFRRPWLFVGLLEVELALAFWLLSGVARRRAWAAGLGCFSIFFGLSLAKAMDGAASCSCFGAISVSPWAGVVLDAVVVLALFGCRPRRDVDARLAFVVLFLLVWAAIGIPAGGFVAARLAGSGVVVEGEKLVLLVPDRWVAERLPILSRIEGVAGDLAAGEWLVVLVRPGCPVCREAIDRLTAHATYGAKSPGLVLVDVAAGATTTGAGNAAEPREPRVNVAHLSPQYNWVVETPLIIALKNGEVESVRRGS